MTPKGAQSFGELREALRIFRAPGLNVVYADVNGNIGYQLGGFIPKRMAGHTGYLDTK